MDTTKVIVWLREKDTNIFVHGVVDMLVKSINDPKSMVGQVIIQMLYFAECGRFK